MIRRSHSINFVPWKKFTNATVEFDNKCFFKEMNSLEPFQAVSFRLLSYPEMNIKNKLVFLLFQFFFIPSFTLTALRHIGRGIFLKFQNVFWKKTAL